MIYRILAATAVFSLGSATAVAQAVNNQMEVSATVDPVLSQPKQVSLGIYNLDRISKGNAIYVLSGGGVGNDTKVTIPLEKFGADANDPPRYLELAAGWL